MKKWLKRLFIGLFSLIGICVAALLILNYMSWPKVSGKIQLTGLTEPVEIIRDAWDIPHIFADNKHDLFFAQGYVHAQDRLFQMESNRRLGLGEVSKIFGERTVRFDQFLRTIGVRRGAENSLALMDTESLEILQAYADGVNAYIDDAGMWLPIEYRILGFEPEPWTPLHTLAFGSYMSYLLSGNSRLEFLRAQLIDAIGKEHTEKILPHHNPNTPLIIPEGSHLYDAFADLNEPVTQSIGSELFGEPDSGWGSNNWVVTGSKTASGKPMLANDIHLGTGFPSTWYGNGLHAEELNLVGFSFPGVPMVVVGHNQFIAWGTSNLNPDSEDIYLEKLDNPKEPKKYQYQDEWHDLKVIDDVVEVKGGSKVPTKILLTHNGPLANKIMRDEDGPAFSIRWTHAEGNRLFLAIVGINKARNWVEFREAAKKWDSPGQNLVYADVDGNVGYQATGRVPVRAKNHNGILPVPGWSEEYAWQKGYLSFEKMPWSYNPSVGFLASANNKITSDDYPYHLALDWYPGFRAQRITEALATSSPLTMQSMRDLQADTYSIPAAELVPYLLEVIKPEDSIEETAHQLLSQWDYRFEEDAVAASIYEAWFYFMVKNTLEDELGEKYKEKYLSKSYHRHSSQVAPMIIDLIDEPEHALFDDKNTSEFENRNFIIQKSFKAGLELLKQKAGEEPSKWQWGKLHTITFGHLAFRNIPVIKTFFNSPTLPMRGEHFTVNAAGYNWSRPFNMSAGVSQRMIIDLADWDNSQMVTPIGQPMHLFHPQRHASMQAWRDVAYHPMGFSKEKIMAGQYQRLQLNPN